MAKSPSPAKMPKLAQSKRVANTKPTTKNTANAGARRKPADWSWPEWVTLGDGTPAMRWTYRFGRDNDPAVALIKRGNDILKRHGDEILKLFGLKFVDSWECSWPWLLARLAEVEHPFRGDIQAGETLAGHIGPKQMRELVDFTPGSGPPLKWLEERHKSFRVDIPHVAVASIAAIRAILDRVESAKSANGGESPWAKRLRDLLRDFKAASKRSQLRFVLVQTIGPDVKDLQPSNSEASENPARADPTPKSGGQPGGAARNYSPWIDQVEFRKVLVMNNIKMRSPTKGHAPRTIGRKKELWGAEFQPGANSQNFRFKFSKLDELKVTYPEDWISRATS